MVWVSWAEVGVTFGVAMLLFGTKDLPKIAKEGGKMVGKLVVYLRKSRHGFDSFARESEMLQLQQEMRQTLFELQEVKSDLRAGMSIMPTRQGASYSPERQSLGAGNPPGLTMPQGWQGDRSHPGTAGAATPTAASAALSTGHVMGLAALGGAEGRFVGPSGYSETARRPEEVAYGPPSEHVAPEYAARSESREGGADHIIEAMILRERLVRERGARTGP